jgi:hypothetical protein
MRSKRRSGLIFAGAWSVILLLMVTGLTMWSLGLGRSLGSPTPTAVEPSPVPVFECSTIMTLAPNQKFASQDDLCAQSLPRFSVIIDPATGTLLPDVHR